ncbi:MAG: c-type cytochrome [Magnetococcales bacterium]|nr:c-type cytochrome [Magnetococcales bacterium]
MHASSTNTLSKFERLIHAHKDEAWRDDHLPRLREWADYMGKQGKGCGEAQAEDLRKFVAWIQKKTHSRLVARQYAVSLIDFYLLLLQEGIITTNPAYALYPVLASMRLPKEEDLDTEERMSHVIRVSQSIARDADVLSDSPSGVRREPVLVPAMPGGMEASYSWHPPQSEWQTGLQRPSFLRRHWKSLLFIAVCLVLIQQMPVIANFLVQKLMDGPEEVITNQKIFLMDKGRLSASQVSRREFFALHQKFKDICKSVLHDNCQNNVTYRNPLNATWDNLVAGQVLFQQHCQSCHGLRGQGMGVQVNHLNPPPARLEFAGKGVLQKDVYLFWTIHDGGEPLGSVMPAFKDLLRDEEIWKLVLYLHHL